MSIVGAIAKLKQAIALQSLSRAKAKAWVRFWLLGFSLGRARVAEIAKVESKLRLWVDLASVAQDVKARDWLRRSRSRQPPIKLSG